MLHSILINTIAKLSHKKLKSMDNAKIGVLFLIAALVAVIIIVLITTIVVTGIIQ